MKNVKLEKLKKELDELKKYGPIADLVVSDFIDNVDEYYISLKDEKDRDLGSNLFGEIIEYATTVKVSEKGKSIHDRKKYFLDLGEKYAVQILVKELISTDLTDENVRVLSDLKLGFHDLRNVDVFIQRASGEKKEFESYLTLDKKFSELFAWLKVNESRDDKIKTACEFHAKFEQLHPYTDGNGRIGRLLLDILLLKFGYLPVRISSKERKEYYESLEKADEGDISLLVNLVEKLQIEAIELFNMNPLVISLKEKASIEDSLNKILDESKFIVLTEDGKIDDYLSTIFESNGYSKAEVRFMSYNGSSNIMGIALFSLFINEKFPDKQIFVHRDRDYLTEDELNKLRKQIDDLGLTLFITKGTDIESHFIQPNHIHFCHPEISVEEAQKMINQVILELEEDSINRIKKKEFGDKYSKKSTHLEKAIIGLYKTDMKRWTHGKTAYKKLKSMIQTKLKKNSNLVQPSDYLLIEEIQK